MITAYKSASPDLLIETDVIFPSSADPSFAENIYQSYIQFTGWDPDSTPNNVMYNNVVASYKLSGNKSAWTVNPYKLGSSCGSLLLKTNKTGGYLATTGPNLDCITAWSATPTCFHSLNL